MLAITSDSFGGYGLDRAFAFAAEAGLEGIEVVIQHENYDTYDADYLNELKKRHNLPIIALAAPVNMSIEKANRVLDLAERVEAKLVAFIPPDIFDFDYKKWMKEDVKELRKKKKVAIALVNPPIKTMLGILPKYAFNDIYELKGVADLVLDTSNTAGKTEPLLDIYSTLRPNIRHVHLANARRDRDHTLLGDGNIPLESFLTRLARDKFEGALTLKLNPTALDTGKSEKVLENIKKCKDYVEKYFRER